MRRHLALLLFVLPIAVAGADVSAPTAQADALHDKGSYADARALMLSSVSGVTDGKDLAELYWRASRETLELGDIAEAEKKTQGDILAVFTQGEQYADKAIAADPKNDLGYYWKSSNIGRWGQVKGILNSLFKAGPMKDLLVKELSLNPDRTDASYVLGQLYRELPGWPASFGNIDAAVSLGRKAVDLRQTQFASGAARELVYNFTTELAKTLWKRNWSADKRRSEQAAKAEKLAAAVTPLDRGSFYEGSVTLKDMSDRDEARVLVQGVITDLVKQQGLNAPELKDLDKARTVLKGW
jgi:hypothetical protein